MSWVATAVVATAVIGGVVSSSAGDKAADAQIQGSQQASDTELEMFYKSREDTAPWREAGEEALNVLAPKVQAGPGEFVPEEDPGFKFGYQEQVEKPLLRSASAGGRLGGGRNLKELSRYSSDYASTKYDNFLNRWYKSLTPLQSMSGIGQTTATQQGQNALATGQMVGQNQLAAGQARASGYQQTGSAIGQVAGGLGQSALDYYYMNKYLKPAAPALTGTPYIT
jgi:hypothetical protein